MNPNVFLCAYLALQVLAMGYLVAKHGEPQKPVNAVSAFVATMILLGLLIMGGAFDRMLLR